MYLRNWLYCFIALILVSAHLDSLINKHWEKLINTNNWKEPSETQQKQNFVANTNFKCDHDQLMKANRFHEHLRNNSKHRDHLKRDAQIFDPQPPTLSDYSPIRIKIKSEYISDTDPLSCHYLNQIVTLETGWINSNREFSYNWQCGTNDILDNEKQILFKEHLIPAVVDIIQSMISVKRVVENLTLSRAYYDTFAWCRNYPDTIPDYLFGPGEPDTDYILFVSARPNAPSSNGLFQLANASPCNLYFVTSTKFSRPYAGWINFNPAALSQLKDGKPFQFSDISNPYLFSQYVKIGLHEVIHALGFTAALFPSFVDNSGQFYSDIGPIIKVPPPTLGLGPFRFKISSPTVVELARKYFNCSNLDGLELEESDTRGLRAGSHWEKRLLGSEFMTPSFSSISILSPFTLALLQDSGWYKVNFSSTERLRWGWKRGCKWTEYPCSIDNWPKDFCSSAVRAKCDSERLGVGFCTLTDKNETIPPYYQHFPLLPTYGGESDCDYCPIIKPYSNYYCQDPIALVAALENQNPFGQVFGKNSWCFDINLQPSSSSIQPSAACYEIKCVRDPLDNSTRLGVKVGPIWVSCSNNTGWMKVATPSSDIQINCPDPLFFCESVDPVNWKFSSGGKLEWFGFFIFILALQISC